MIDQGRIGVDDDNPVNETQPAAAAVDRNIDEIVSGMPAGGPRDIGLEASEIDRGSADPQAIADPFGAGMDAFSNGVGRDACPYPDGIEERRRWLDGWEHQRNAEGIA